jgi:hypothetical protein
MSSISIEELGRRLLSNQEANFAKIDTIPRLEPCFYFFWGVNPCRPLLEINHNRDRNAFRRLYQPHTAALSITNYTSSEVMRLFIWQPILITKNKILKTRRRGFNLVDDMCIRPIVPCSRLATTLRQSLATNTFWAPMSRARSTASRQAIASNVSASVLPGRTLVEAPRNTPW